MADTIKIAPEISAPKLDARFERMMKEVGNKTARNLKASDLGKYNKEWDKLLKNLDLGGVKMGKFAKIMKDNTVRAFKEQERAMDDFGKSMDRMHKRYERQARIADRLVGMKARRYGFGSAGEFESAMPRMAGAMRGAAGGRAAYNQEMLGGQLAQGAQWYMDKQREWADEEKQRAFQKWNKLAMAGQIIQGVGGVIQGGADWVGGHSLRTLGFDVSRAGPYSKIYADITSGNYGSLYAMAKDKGVGDRLKAIAADQYGAAAVGQTGAVIGNAGGALSQGATAGAAAAAGVPAAAGSSLAGAAGSGIAAGKGVTNMMAGSVSAAQAEAAVQAMEMIKGLSPIQMMQFEALSGRLPGLSRMMALGGTASYVTGSLGARSHDATNNTNLNMYKAMMLEGQLGGRTIDEVMPLFQGLRGMTSHTAAMGLAGKAAGAEFNWGLGSGAAAQGLGGFAMMGGGNQLAETRMIETMRKAMKLGIQDSQLKEAITMMVPEFAFSMSGGRASTTMMLDQTMMAAQRNSGGGVMDMTDINVGRATAAGLNKVTSGHSGLNALDVRKAQMIYQIPGLSAGARLAISQMSLQDLNSAAFDRIAAEEGKDPNELRAQIQGKFAGLLGPSQAGFKSGAADFVTGQVLGIGADAAGRMREGLSGLNNGAPMGDAARAPLSIQEKRLQDSQQANAANMNHRFVEAISDPKMIEGLEKVTRAGTAIADLLSNVERHDPEKLKDVDKLLKGVTTALYDFADAVQYVNGALGYPYVGGKKGP